VSWFRPCHHVRVHVLFRLLDSLGDIMAKLSDLQAAQAVTNQKLDEMNNRIAQLPQAEDLQPAIDAEVALQQKIDSIAQPAAPAPTV